MVFRDMRQWIGALAFAWLASASAVRAAELPKLVVLPFAQGAGAPERAGARFTGLMTDELRTRDDEVRLVAAPVSRAGGLAAGAPGRGPKRQVDAEAALAEGKRALADLSFDEAVSSLKKGLEASLASPATADFAAVFDGYISLAVAYFRQGEEKAAQGALFTVARLDPGYQLPEGKFPPVFTRELEKAKKRAEKAGKGSISIEGPPGATAFVDGRDLGMVPVLEEDLPVGPHYVKVEGTQGELFGQVVELKGSLGKVKAVFPGAQAHASAAGSEPKISAVLDAEVADQVAQYARLAGADFVLVGQVYRSGEYQLTVASALYSARQQGFSFLRSFAVDHEMLTANVEAFRLADEVGNKVDAFGAPAGLPLRLAPEAAPKVAVVKVVEVEVPTGPRVVVKASPDPEESPGGGKIRALARPSTFEGEATRFDPDPDRPQVAPLKTGTPAWVWIVVGVGVAAAAGGTYYGVSEATRPVTGTVTATW